MVRNGVVSHPSDWPFEGYNEIQTPRRKCVLIAYQKLAELTGCNTYDSFQKHHKKFVNELLEVGNHMRQAQWTESIAVGSEEFIQRTKKNMRFLVPGRRVHENDGEFQLREKREPLSSIPIPKKAI